MIARCERGALRTDQDFGTEPENTRQSSSSLLSIPPSFAVAVDSFPGPMVWLISYNDWPYRSLPGVLVYEPPLD